MVESLTSGREVGVRYLPPPCCVLEQRHIYSPKSTGNTKEAVAPSRHDLKLLTWTLSINTNKLSINLSIHPSVRLSVCKQVICHPF